MKTISYDKLMSIKMLSKEAWQKLHKELPIDEYLHAEDEKLAYGFARFVEIWLEDNGLAIDIWESSRNFFDWETGRQVRYGGKNLEDDLLTRWAEYLLRD